MARTQKYPTEFRREAVDLVKGGMKQADVCRLLGVSNSALSKWVVTDRRRNDPEFMEGETLEEEVVRLRKQVRDQSVDISILKRSIAFFARETIR
jgi:transposase